MNLQEALQKSFSQAQQDVFALYINEFRDSGYFIDLGSNEPFVGNNSALIESLGWKGFMVDMNEILVARCRAHRNNPAVSADLTKVKVSHLMDNFFAPEIIDFVSMDLDDNAAWPCIQDFDFNKHKIRCMTFEHDAYLRGNDMRDASRKFLTDKGLKMICADVGIFGGKSFEDWYVNPELVNEAIYKPIQCEGKDFTQIFVL